MPPKPVPYYTIRDSLISGSIILWKSPGIIPRLIRVFSEYSHASLVIRDYDDDLKDHVFLVEALANGLVLRRLSLRLEGYTGQAYALIPPISLPQQRAIRRFAWMKCSEGIPYDYWGLLGNIFGRVSHSAWRYFCSEFVLDAHATIGTCPPQSTAGRPGDIPKRIKGVLREIEALPAPMWGCTEPMEEVMA